MKVLLLFGTLSLFNTAATFAQDVSIEVHFGDRVTRFEITADVKAPLLTVRSNDLGVTTAKMTTRNYDYVVRRLREIARLPANGSDCARSRVDARYPEDQKPKSLRVCLNGKGEQRDAMSALLDLLSASI